MMRHHLSNFSLSHHSGKESITLLFATEMEEEDDLFDKEFFSEGGGGDGRLDTVLVESVALL